MRNLRLLLVLWILAGCGGLLAASCGGGGGGDGTDGGSAVTPGSTDTTGTAAVLIADGPADDYDAIWITITEISLIPAAHGDSSAPVVVYQSSEGHEINLLDYRDQDYLFTIKDGIPPGRYAKVRLRVSRVRTEGGDCDRMEVKLPSGKIDLNPRGGFEVKAGQTITVRLDIDANKSINLHTAGHSGKCIFRPVVFVDIDTIHGPQRCPRILQGTIRRLIDENDDGTPEAFDLALPGRRGTLRVSLAGETVVFDENGDFVGPDALQPGQPVRVRGRLQPDGSLRASVVVIGATLELRGSVAGPVESVDERLQFPLDLDPNQAVVDDRIDVVVGRDTLVLAGCDEEVGLDAIQPGMRAQVVGKLSHGDLLAVVVLLEPEQIHGMLTAITPVRGGHTLTVRTAPSPIPEGDEISIFLPRGVPIHLEGDGVIDLGLLDDLVDCMPRKVRVVLDPDTPQRLTATEVRIDPAEQVGRIASVDAASRTLALEDGTRVRVEAGATILAEIDGSDELVPFDYLQPGDDLTLFGLRACEGDSVDFHAFIIAVDARE